MKFFCIFLILLIIPNFYFKTCSSGKFANFAWPASFQEQIKTYSSQPKCENDYKCRDWNEVKNIAFCKSAKLASLLPQEYNLYYVLTYFKTENFDEYAKFIYGFIEPKESKITYVKLCIPIDRSRKSWFDDRCPLDDCGEMGDFEGKCGNEKIDSFGFELKKLDHKAVNQRLEE